MPGSQTTRVIPSTNTYDLELAEQDIADLRSHVTTTQEASTQTDVTDQPITPTGGNTQFSSSGQQKYVGSDGNAYSTGRLSLVTTGDHTISSVTDVALPELGNLANGAAIRYTVRGIVFWQQTTTNTAQSIGMQGANLASGTRVLFMGTPISGNSQSFQFIAQAISNTDVAFGGTVASGAVNAIHISGQILYSAPDVMGLKGLASSGTNTWVLKAGSFIEFMPVT